MNDLEVKDIKEVLSHIQEIKDRYIYYSNKEEAAYYITIFADMLQRMLPLHCYCCETTIDKWEYIEDLVHCPECGCSQLFFTMEEK